MLLVFYSTGLMRMSSYAEDVVVDFTLFSVYCVISTLSVLTKAKMLPLMQNIKVCLFAHSCTCKKTLNSYYCYASPNSILFVVIHVEFY